MLVLSRLVGQSVMIGDNVMVTVMAVESSRTRIQVSRVSTPPEIISDSWLQVDEQVQVDADVSCMIVKIVPNNNKIRLGVIAPLSVPVLRKELDKRPPQASRDAQA